MKSNKKADTRPAVLMNGALDRIDHFSLRAAIPPLGRCRVAPCPKSGLFVERQVLTAGHEIQ